MNDPSAVRPREAGAHAFWDYSALAKDYERRAPYAADVVATLRANIGLAAHSRVLDIGAGTGRLTCLLALDGLRVTAIEPNAAMRRIGIENTRGLDVAWHEAKGEATGLSSGEADLVTYGSSLNVIEPAKALVEASRLLRASGWMMCLWNHRDLTDPLQQQIEASIRGILPDFRYGARRQDPTTQIHASGHFEAVQSFERRLVHCTSSADFVAGFRAHATLQRQAGKRFDAVLAAIEHVVGQYAWIRVPFTTRVWYARRRDR